MSACLSNDFALSKKCGLYHENTQIHCKISHFHIYIEFHTISPRAYGLFIMLNAILRKLNCIEFYIDSVHVL